MNNNLFIAGDWGTTSLRLNLCDAESILDNKSGAGISKINSSPAEVLFDLITPWTNQYGTCPIYLSGMIGSNIGWITTPYVDCPAKGETLAEALTPIKYNDHDIYIAAGLACINPIGSPDLMRGEETQILGAIELHNELKHGSYLLCLPGTHTKWVYLQDGIIQFFHTSLTGELFALLSDHSILIQSPPDTSDNWQKSFIRGIERSEETKETELLHTLFEVRTKQIKQELSPSDASAYLSGLIIGKDINGACVLFKENINFEMPIVIIGETQLTSAYKFGIETYGLSAIECDGSSAATTGLRILSKGKN